MSYFSEIGDYRTYLGEEADFHFSYNANTGGGQSFLGGKFRGAKGTLCPANALNGRIALFQFSFGEGGRESVSLDDPKTKYEIKPRATGDTNMKLAVGRNTAPSKAIATFFMLPNTCGVKKAANFDTSVLCQENFWLQSMWLDVDMAGKRTVILKPKDCIFCGGVGEDGGTLRCFSLDFSTRMADVLRLYENSSKLESEVADCIKLFGDIYSGAAAFEYEKCANAVQDLMEFLKEMYPAEYSGVSDPLSFISYIARDRSDSICLADAGNAVDLKQEFYKWMISIGKSTKTALDNSRTYLPSISDEMAPPVKNIWHGIREYLYGEKPAKKLYELSSFKELLSLYSGIDRVFASDSAPGSFDAKRFSECWNWAHSSDNHNSVSAAWSLFKQFMQWRETQAKQDKQPVGTVDRLDVALKLFEKKRYETEWQDKTRKDGYRNIYDMAAMTPEQIAAGSLDDFYNDFLLKIWAFKNGGSRRYGQLDEAGRKAYRQFVVDLKTQLKSFDAYFPPDPKCPDGMGVGVLTELMMRFWPKSCCNYNASLIHEALVTLHMAEGDFVWPKTPSVYQDFMGKCATILLKMEQMKLPRRSDPGNDEPPDYITVNEFLWFVREYKDLIQEEAMSKEFKKAPKKAKTGARKLSEAVKDDDMMQRLMAALRTKPFAILAGHSGTGKSQLVRRLAYMTCNDEGLLAERNDYNAPGNYCMVQVKPNWHDSTDLLGYYTEMNGGKYHTTSFVEFICKAYAYPETPFFVCLDEMNLAPVEQYFAEFLSAIESYSETTKCTDRLITEKASPEEICGETKLTESLEEVKKHGLTIPRNLFVVGTVNVDETTCQFSRKVLDRAMTILMTAVSFKSMTEPNDPSKEECLDPAGIRFFLERPTQTALVQGQMDRLDEVQKQIGDTPFAIAYRFANEYALYQAAYQILMDKGVGSDGKPDLNDAESQKTALDHVVLMKLLPRIHGERRVVEGIFKGRKVKGQDGDRDLQGLSAKVPDGLSAEMMDKILARPDEYLTFWP